MYTGSKKMRSRAKHTKITSDNENNKQPRCGHAGTGVTPAAGDALKQPRGRKHPQAWGVDVRMQKPLRKTWRGADGKITHLECAQFMNGLPKRTSQETRDACLLCWVVANLPIRLRV